MTSACRSIGKTIRKSWKLCDQFRFSGQPAEPPLESLENRREEGRKNNLSQSFPVRVLAKETEREKLMSAMEQKCQQFEQWIHEAETKKR